MRDSFHKNIGSVINHFPGAAVHKHEHREREENEPVPAGAEPGVDLHGDVLAEREDGSHSWNIPINDFQYWQET